jgi:hypothetical protein
LVTAVDVVVAGVADIKKNRPPVIIYIKNNLKIKIILTHTCSLHWICTIIFGLFV